MRRGTFVTAVVTLIAFAGAESASATIVYKHGNEVWAMNDDGSDQRVLATPDPLGMEAGLGDPHVAPNGSTVVFSGSTNRNYHTCGAGVQYWGQHASGIYRWRDGVVTRLSQAPSGQPTCITSIHAEPEATTNGRVLNELLLNVNGTFGHGFQSGTQEGPADANNPTACDNAVGLADPSPNPANPDQFAYLGCTGGGGQDAVAVSQGSTHTTPVVDDSSQRSVGWRSDGGRLVVSEGGTEPGLWTYNPASPVAPVHVLNGEFSGVNFAGANDERLVFSSAGEIWSVPASCTAATCSFPASATRLTPAGANDHPSWTSNALKPAAASTTPGGSTGGGGPTGGGGTTGGGSSGGGGPIVDVRNVIAGAALDKRATTRGVSFYVALGAPATLEFTFYVMKGRKARKLGTARRRGVAGPNVFKFTRAGRKKFKRGLYRAEIRAVLDGQKGPSKRVSFRIRK